MRQTFITVLLLSFLIVQPAYSQDFQVRSIDLDRMEAVLLDENTGELWTVVERDIVEGWKVVRIQESGVTISMPLDDHTIAVTELPKPGGRLHMIAPNPQ